MFMMLPFMSSKNDSGVLGEIAGDSCTELEGSGEATAEDESMKLDTPRINEFCMFS